MFAHVGGSSIELICCNPKGKVEVYPIHDRDHRMGCLVMATYLPCQATVDNGKQCVPDRGQAFAPELSSFGDGCCV